MESKKAQLSQEFKETRNIKRREQLKLFMVLDDILEELKKLNKK